MTRTLLKELNQRPIAYYPIYRKITGSTTAGILLSQLMYWLSKDDKIYKTDMDLREETFLTKDELKSAKKAIKKLDFITVSLEGLPAKTYYEIDWKKYETSLGKSQQPVGGNPTNTDVEIPPTVRCKSHKHYNDQTMLHTETTTETTTEKSVATKVATHLLNKILSYKPNFKKPTSLKSWIDDIDKAMRLDNRTEEELINCINWIYADSNSFWAGNIMSGKKLREKFDTMESQMMRDKLKNGVSFLEPIDESGKTGTDAYRELLRNPDNQQRVIA